MESTKEFLTQLWPYLVLGVLILIYVATVLVFIAVVIETLWLAWKRHKTKQAERRVEELKRRLGGAAYGLESEFHASVRELQRLADLHREP